MHCFCQRYFLAPFHSNSVTRKNPDFLIAYSWFQPSSVLQQLLPAFLQCFLLLALSTKHSFTHRHSFQCAKCIFSLGDTCCTGDTGVVTRILPVLPSSVSNSAGGELEGSIAGSGIRNPAFKMHLLAFQIAVFGRGMNLLFTSILCNKASKSQ